MQAGRLATARLVRTLAAPLVLALPPLFWVAEATRRASLTPLGRDQGIFQYIAWAIGQGDRDYRDVRDVNGPLTHMVHRLMLALGGADEHRFRVLDLVVTGASFAIVGACLPGLRDRRSPSNGPGTEWIERLAWAFAAWVVLSGQYLLYGYWDLAQRESFFDWFMLPSVALQLVAQARWRQRSDSRHAKARVRLFALVGALSVLPWLGKPTYAAFTVVQLLTLWADAGMPLGRLRALRAFAIGGAIAAVGPLAWVLLHGDLPAYLHIQAVDVPAMYRFIWPRAATDTFSRPWDAQQAIYAIVGAMVILSLVLMGEMPVRAVAPALVPVAALLGIVVQAKGFPYHFHPVTAGVHLQWLVFAAWLTERIARRAARSRPWSGSRRSRSGWSSRCRSRRRWKTRRSRARSGSLWGANTPEDRTTREYYEHFPEPDFFPFEMHQTADYLRAHTAPSDRVQTYGMDPYVLFLAGRLCATPYIYAYDLDADAALGGGTGAVPDDAQRARIRAIRDQHESDLARPPRRPAPRGLRVLRRLAPHRDGRRPAGLRTSLPPRVGMVRGPLRRGHPVRARSCVVTERYGAPGRARYRRGTVTGAALS